MDDSTLESEHDEVLDTLWQQAREGLMDVRWDEERNEPMFRLTAKGKRRAEELIKEMSER